MTDPQIANLLGKTNGYEIAYRSAKLLSEIPADPNLEMKTNTAIKLVIEKAMTEYPKVFSDRSLRDFYTRGLFSALNIQHPPTTTSAEVAQ